MKKFFIIVSIIVLAGMAYPVFAECVSGDCNNGAGVMTWPNGNKYTGSFRNGTMELKGVMSWANGDKYDGYWQKGKMHGSGKMTYANGDRYEGTFIRDKMSTFGTIVYANGTTYSGMWTEGRIEGMGTMTWSNGDKYDGNFKNNKRHGRGAMTWKNGQKADGQWKEDVFQGDMSAPKELSGVPSSWNGDYAFENKPMVKALAIKNGKIYTVSGSIMVESFPGKSTLKYVTTYSDSECKQTAGTTVSVKYTRDASGKIKCFSSGSVYTYVKIK
jgi:hypothetical protein